MSDAQNYDVTNLENLRRDLKGLRTQARKDGVLKASTAEKDDPGGKNLARRFAALRHTDEQGDRGKQLVNRLQSLLRRGEDDVSPTVIGTNFTEQGVNNLLNQLLAPPKALKGASPMLQRIHKFLTTPPSDGGKLVAGANPERVRMLAKLLPQIETHGWEQVKSQLSERRERLAEGPWAARAAAVAQETAAAAKPKRVGKKSR